MQQRRLRLGDILDDYCPRERRITNHAVVAMIDDEVKQTRCTTCDADHEYKAAKVPPRRKRPDAALAGDGAEGLLRPRAAHEDAESIEEPSDAEQAPDDPIEPIEDAPLLADGAEADADVEGEEQEGGAGAEDDDGPVHRRLIRATLPRPEGQVPERKSPDFTVRQPGGRGGRELDGNKNGHRPGRRHARAPGGGAGGGQGPSRFGGPRQGSGSSPWSGGGQGQRPAGNRPGHPGGQRGNRPGQGQGPSRGGRKRGR
jgi:hypothetical protein